MGPLSFNSITHRLRTGERWPGRASTVNAPKASKTRELFHTSPIASLERPFAANDCTSTVSGILSSLERACAVTGKKVDAALDRIYEGSHKIYSRFREMEKGTAFSILADETGSVTLKHMISFTIAGLAGLAMASGVFGSVSLLSYGLWFAATYVGTLSLTGALDNADKRYGTKRSVFPFLLTTATLATRFWLQSETQVDNWVLIPLTFTGIFGGNLLMSWFHNRLFEPGRHRDLNAYQKNKLNEMDSITAKLKRLQEKKWNDQKFDEVEDARKIRHLSQRLKELVKETRGFRFPSWWKIALYRTSRIYSTLFYLPLAALFMSKGYDWPIAAAFSTFWISQLIYTPTGKTFSEHMEIGELSENVIYGDLPKGDGNLTKNYLRSHFGNDQQTNDIWQAMIDNGYIETYEGDDETAQLLCVGKTLSYRTFKEKFSCFGEEAMRKAFYVLEQSLPMEEQPLPRTVHFRLSNRGLYRDMNEGDVPVFLLRDIINCMVSGFKVRIVLDNDAHNWYYPETAGAVANANVIGARAQILWNNIFPNIPEIKKLPRQEKIDLLKVFFAEHSWDPTWLFDNACNSTFQGAWPVEAWNRLFNDQGIEAGDRYCGLALEKLFADKAGQNSKFQAVSDMIYKYSSRETRFSLYNIFDDEYVDVCAYEIAERIKDVAQAPAIAGLIKAHREEYLTKIYHEKALKMFRKHYPKSASEGLYARSWHLAQTFITSIQTSIKRSEAAPLVEKYLLGLPVEYEAVEKIREVHDLDEPTVIRLLEEARKADLVRFPAYLAERCLMPDDVWVQMRDIIMQILAFDRKSEDSNLPRMMEAMNQYGPTTEGQKMFIDRLARMLNVHGTDRGQQAQAIVDYIRTFVYDKGMPDPTQVPEGTSLKIAHEAQAQFKMQNLLLKRGFKSFVSFVFWGTIRAFFTRSGKRLTAKYVPGKKRYGKKIPWTKPFTKNEKIAHWLNALGVALAQELGRVQLMSGDYIDQFDKVEPLAIAGTIRQLIEPQVLQAARFSVETLVFEAWKEGKLDYQNESIEHLVGRVIDTMLNDDRFKKYSKYHKNAPEGTRRLIKYKLTEIILDEFKKNRYMINATLHGLAWILAHETEGLRFITDHAMVPNGPHEDKRLTGHLAKQTSAGSTPLPAEGELTRESLTRWIEQARLADVREAFAAEKKVLEDLLTARLASHETEVDLDLYAQPDLSAVLASYPGKFTYNGRSSGKLIVKGAMTEEEKKAFLACAMSLTTENSKDMKKKEKDLLDNIDELEKRSKERDVAIAVLAFEPAEEFIDARRSKYFFNRFSKELKIIGTMTPEEKELLTAMAREEAQKSVRKNYTGKIEALYKSSQPNATINGVLGGLNTIINKGISGFKDHKGFLLNVWELYWEAAETLFGKENLYYRAERRMAINQLSRPSFRRIKGAEAKDFEKNEDLYSKDIAISVRRLTALIAAKRYIAEQLRWQLHGVQNPDFIGFDEESIGFFSLETYMADHLAQQLVEAYMKGELNAPAPNASTPNASQGGESDG
ncbi:MAG: hypothetical protein KKH83_02985 [Candidatus Margulisbacteria bacterium]|nr:hypothetical protein [Candidatus Margulisiibacteriota bacterium]